jgi:hypothetical protein
MNLSKRAIRIGCALLITAFPGHNTEYASRTAVTAIVEESTVCSVPDRDSGEEGSTE